MRRYDGIYLLSDKLKSEILEKAIEKIESAIEGLGGQVQRNAATQEDGSPVRALKKQSSGTYVEIAFELEPDKVNTLYAAHKLDDNILRAMIVLARKVKSNAQDEVPEGQTTEGVKNGISE